VFGAGALASTSGHGIHLAANSVGNADPARPRTCGTRSSATGSGSPAWPWCSRRWRARWSAAHGRTLGYVLALAVGLTWASNAVGGGTEVLSLVVSLAAVAFGWSQRRGLGVVLLVGYAPAVPILVGALLR
jgi:hypothetical protein